MAKKKLLFSWPEYRQGRIWHWLWWQKHWCHYSGKNHLCCQSPNIPISSHWWQNNFLCVFTLLATARRSDLLGVIQMSKHRCLHTPCYLWHPWWFGTNVRESMVTHAFVFTAAGS